MSIFSYSCLKVQIACDLYFSSAKKWAEEVAWLPLGSDWQSGPAFHIFKDSGFCTVTQCTQLPLPEQGSRAGDSRNSDKPLLREWNNPVPDAYMGTVLSCNSWKWKMRSPLQIGGDHLPKSQVRQMFVLGCFCRLPIVDLLSILTAWGRHTSNPKLLALVPPASVPSRLPKQVENSPSIAFSPLNSRAPWHHLCSFLSL